MFYDIFWLSSPNKKERIDMRVAPVQRSFSVYENNNKQNNPNFKAIVKVDRSHLGYFAGRERGGSLSSLLDRIESHFKAIGDDFMKVFIEPVGTNPPAIRIKVGFDPPQAATDKLMEKYKYFVTEEAKDNLKNHHRYAMENLRIPTGIWGAPLPGYGSKWIRTANNDEYMRSLRKSYPQATAEKDLFFRILGHPPNPEAFKTKDEKLTERIMRIFLGKPPDV